MRNLVGVLAAALAILIALPTPSTCGENFKKFGLELQLGGGYSLLKDVNDYAPSDLAAYSPEQEVNIGAQYGIGVLYRHMKNFGWQFAYNKFTYVQNFRISAMLSAQESWAEQSIDGGELYALATWYKSLSADDVLSGELFFGVGPGLYYATVDRSINIIKGTSAPLTDGSFSGAHGKSLGLLGVVGFEMMFGEKTALAFQFGARRAVVGKLEYKDQLGRDLVVWEDPNLYTADPQGDLAKMTVDYTGAFIKVALRQYFEPASNWRSPKR
jgi:hypothetical protein